MLVRVYQPVGDVPCRVVWPNPAARLSGENDMQFINRIGALAELRDSTLAGVPYIQVSEFALPTNRTVDTGPNIENHRTAWRVVGNAVIVDPAKIVTTPKV